MATQIPLQDVEQLLLSISESSVSLLTDTTTHILSAGGKRLRPRLVLLAFAATGGKDTDKVVPLAAAVEIIHTATLVHDDINDRGTIRRGRETVNSRWGSIFALLTGDYLFTKTYELMAPYSHEINAALAKAAIELVEGETLQIQAAKEGRLDRDTYLEIIAKKTASLFVASTTIGALAADAPQEQIDALGRFAYDLGLAFQITDDILDLIADPEQIGKNAGIDLAQGRGLAAAIARSGDREGNGRHVQQAEAVLTQDTAPAPLKQSIAGSGPQQVAIEQGRAKARELVTRAVAHLDDLPPSDIVDELRDLARLVLERDH